MSNSHIFAQIKAALGREKCLLNPPKRLHWLFSLTCPALSLSFSLSYLPVLVSMMMPLAQHLKEASTAPTATASEGSRVRTEERLRPSNSCRWKVAASASRAI